MDQFIDMCILLGCDYAPQIRGIGPRKAYELIQKHKSIENILENIDTKVGFYCFCLYLLLITCLSFYSLLLVALHR